MGIKLVEEVMDYAPDTLTAGEWKGLIVLARDANEETRLTFSKINDPEILRRVRLSIPAWSNLRSALIRKGVLEVHEAGVKGRSARYRIPVMDPKNLHPTDEESGTPAEDLHPVDETSDTTLHPSDEASAGFFIQQMTPTPLSSSSTSPLSGDAEPIAPVDEREIDVHADTTKVSEAWAAARGRGRNPEAEAKVRVSAAKLLAADWSIPDLIALAEDMARAKPSYTDLAKHEPYWLPTRAAPITETCGRCCDSLPYPGWVEITNPVTGTDKIVRCDHAQTAA
jgi:hypothetical protein